MAPYVEPHTCGPLPPLCFCAQAIHGCAAESVELMFFSRVGWMLLRCAETFWLAHAKDAALQALTDAACPRPQAAKQESTWGHGAAAREWLAGMSCSPQRQQHSARSLPLSAPPSICKCAAPCRSMLPLICLLSAQQQHISTKGALTHAHPKHPQ